MKARTSLILALAAGLTAGAQTLDLKGRVLDKADNRPVPGALVKVVNSLLSATTDSAGRFSLEGDVAALREGGKTRVAAPHFRDGYLHIQAPESDRIAAIEIFNLAGESLGSAKSTLRPGWNRVRDLPLPRADFLGFTRVSLGRDHWILPLLRLDGHLHGLGGSAQAPIPGPSSATAASRPVSGPARKGATSAALAGSVEISQPGLATRTVPFAAATQDLGDIRMDYPPRRLDVGAPPIYGAKVLFDGSRGRAAALAELGAKWQDWPRFTPSAVQFKLAKDPEFPNDTDRVTLQSCCNTVWGMDDIQAKEAHGDAQLHVEWMGMGQYDQAENPDSAASVQTLKGAGYINSGVYVQSRYEIQIETPGVSDADHTMAALVDDFPADSQTPNRGNGKWQCYDITFRSARYDASGARTANARITVWWNGVKIHANRDARAPATGLSADVHSGEELDATLYGLKLQSEGRDVRFRNIWMKPLEIPAADTDFGY